MSVRSLFEQLVPRVVGFCLCLGQNLQFWNFGKRGKWGKHFPCFPGLVIMLLPEYFIFCLRWAEICYFWNFEEWANRANVFPVFPDWL